MIRFFIAIALPAVTNCIMKMVLPLFIIMGCLNITIVNAQNTERDYKQAMGGRLGLVGKHQVYSDIDLLALSYKNFFTRKSAFEINMGWGLKSVGATQTMHGISLSASYQLHFPISNTGLRPFVGAGAAAIYTLAQKSEIRNAVSELSPAIYPIFGIDYKSVHNFNITIDLRPMNIFTAKNASTAKSTKFAPYAGMSFRRTF